MGRRRTKLDLQMPRRRVHHRAPNSRVANDLVAKLAKMHQEHKSIGPLLFGIKYRQEITECPDTPATLAERTFGSKGYGTDISKGMRLAVHVLVRGDTK